MYTHHSDLKMAKCHIKDAVFEDNAENKNSSDYKCWIIMTLIDVATETEFKSKLTEEEIRAIVGLKDRKLLSADLIKFAGDLRSRTEPVMVFVDPDNEELTTEMIQTGPDQIQDETTTINRDKTQPAAPNEDTLQVVERFKFDPKRNKKG